MQASAKLLEAAQVLSATPQAMQLRYLQTLTAIAGDKSSTIVFPLPGEWLSALGKVGELAKNPAGDQAKEHT
jgi:regulator of protease activity HflC (stomatin/prohibitin superfamily)